MKLFNALGVMSEFSIGFNGRYYHYDHLADAVRYAQRLAKEDSVAVQA